MPIGRGKPEFLCAEDSCNCNIPSREELPVCLQNHPLPKTVLDECAVGLGKPEFPWQSCIVNGASGGCTGASVITGNEDNLRSRFRDTGRNCADTRLTHQLDGDAGIPVRVF